MKIKLKSTYNGPKGNFPIGHIFTDLPDVEAQQLVAGGYADELTEDVQPLVEEVIEETTVAEKPVETTAKRTPKKRGHK